MIEQEYEKNTKSLAKLFKTRNEYTVLLEYYEVKVNLDLLFCNAVRVIVRCVWFFGLLFSWAHSSSGHPQGMNLEAQDRGIHCISWTKKAAA